MSNRYLRYVSSGINSGVASRLTIKVQLQRPIILYTDNHDHNEEIRSIPHFGGMWRYDLNNGMMYRNLYYAPSSWRSADASRLIIKVQSKRQNIYSTRTITISMKMPVIFLFMVVLGAMV